MNLAQQLDEMTSEERLAADKVMSEMGSLEGVSLHTNGVDWPFDITAKMEQARCAPFDQTPKFYDTSKDDPRDYGTVEVDSAAALNAVADDWPLNLTAEMLKDHPCSRCGGVGLHACTGAPPHGAVFFVPSDLPETFKPAEADPTGRAPNTPGAKLDAGKAPVFRGAFQYFPRALKAVAQVSGKGAAKYTWNGWEDVPDGINRYSDAMGRHVVAEVTEGPIDSDTGELHAAQVAWNALARLELMLREQEAKQ